MNCKIIKIEPITHNVNLYVLEKPVGYSFIPGQATEVSINKVGWEENKHPFTFTSLNSEDYLEFIIKSYPVTDYPNHSGMTEELLSLKVGDELIIGEPWGSITYFDKGVFIAGGTGITPFIAILRSLKKECKVKGNKLFVSNKLEKDIILREELMDIFSDNPEDLVFTLTQEKVSTLHHGRIDMRFLKNVIGNFDQHFYVCGPRTMKQELTATLATLGVPVESIIFEK